MKQAVESTKDEQQLSLSTERLPASPTQLFKNPVPVAVVLVPVLAIDPRDGTEKTGILTVRRGIEPQRGHLALPGGYMGYERWDEAARRELFEETGIALPPHIPIKLLGIESVREATRIIIFGQVPAIERPALDQFVPNDEVSELKILFEPQELAFSTHTDAVRNFFEHQRQH